MATEDQTYGKYFDHDRFERGREVHIYRIGILETMLAYHDDPQVEVTLPGVLHEATLNELSWRLAELDLPQVPARR